MDIHLIAVLYTDLSKKQISAFRLLDYDSQQIMEQPYQAVYSVVKSKKANIHGIKYDIVHDCLKGSNGSFDRYAGIVGDNVLSNPVNILYTCDNNFYIVCNHSGKITTCDLDMVLRYSKMNGISNGKVVKKDGTEFISAINGEYDTKNIAKNSTINKANEQNNNNNTNTVSKVDNVKVSEEVSAQVKANLKSYDKKSAEAFNRHRAALNRVWVEKPAVVSLIPNSDKLNNVDESCGFNVGQKLYYPQLVLKKVRPFYYSMLRAIDIVESDSAHGVNTMGVTLSKLYFNSDFILDKPLAELVFAMLHEICHIAMQHRIRQKGRKHKIWNYACDFYINKFIADEFGITSKGEIVKIGEYYIALPTWVLFNPNIDINVDTPESLYEELVNLMNQDEEENQDNSQNDDGGEDGEESNQGGQSDSNGNSETDNNDDSSGQCSNEGSQDESQAGDSGNQSGDSGDSGDSEDDADESFGGGGSSDDDSDDSEGSGGGSSSSKSGSKNKQSRANGSDDESGDLDGDAQVTDSSDTLSGKKFRGMELPDFSDIESDIFDDKESRSMSNEQLEQKSKSTLNKAVTIHKQTKSFGGETGSMLERIVEKALAPKIDWRKLMKNYLTLASQKVNTFSAPDKRFRSRNMIMPGPKKLDNDAIDGVKICIDTSGSITDRDLGIALAQIKQLLDTFKAEAELLYWDTQVRISYPFTDVKEIMSKKPLGGGGTDANCIFNYFETERDYKIGKRKRPSVILVFTDGCFSTIDSKYHKYKNTIWIVNDNPRFKGPFGKSAPFKDDIQ